MDYFPDTFDWFDNRGIIAIAYIKERITSHKNTGTPKSEDAQAQFCTSNAPSVCKCA